MSAALDIQIVTPAALGSRVGNRVTAERWEKLLQALGHRAQVTPEYDGADCDLLMAVHARRSAASAAAFREAHPERPLVVALAGTDLYRDIHGDAEAQRSLEIADRLIVLHPRAADDLPRALRSRVRVVVQSVELPELPSRKAAQLRVCVVAHLREVKDPLRAAAAARLLPATSRIRIAHVGAALEPGFADAARAEEAGNPRYAWLGELPHDRTLRVLAGSHLHVISSRMEGGSNALSEAIACGVPTLSSRISASAGILGEGYPGFFPTGDTDALADLMQRFEGEPEFRATLQLHTEALAELVRPEREKAALAELIEELRRRGDRPPER